MGTRQSQLCTIFLESYVAANISIPSEPRTKRKSTLIYKIEYIEVR